MVLLQEVEAINQSADKAVRDTGRTLQQLFLLIKKSISDIQQQIRSQQKTQIDEYFTSISSPPSYRIGV